MKILSELISNLEVVETTGESSLQISSIHFDSKLVEKKSLFVAIKGTSRDGHDFIEEAIKRGATAIVCDQKILKKKPNVTYIRVHDSRIAVALLAQNFYDHPSQKLRLIGVTGTNGKTTTATLLFNLFNSLGYSCALLSTIENKINKKTYPATHTTYEPVALTSFLNEAVSEGCEYAFMECSSHAIDQKRVWGLEFAGAIFTNLTLDHLDYHKTMEAYAKSKKELFDNLSEKSFAVINKDDAWAKYLASQTKAKKYFFSLKETDIKQSLEGLEISWDGETIKSRLIGAFNAYNVVGVYITATLLGIPKEKVLSHIAKLTPPSGRLEFLSSQKGVHAVLDYAHTPDALENVLKTVREITPKGNKIITIVGCGGERDVSKRPIMGKIAFDLSDYTVFSSDNPRSEDPEQILQEMTMGLPSETGRYESESDRAKAIKKAFDYAKAGDIVLLAGKGHEDYQVLKEGKIHFSEKEQWGKISK
ncbi:MAG: UDP-N-acetylmuramoyl-L-alanyl-D-glutamate--2,6-diaminopimelate ligase [Candidatus Zambryskibacteria bacterium CG11_big_fil_rev_8_21_14_0_20_42_18]|uniref:UDP-N-acetylmuramoyl-L-alanyl-D-glutamate--2,6-diaminopimelate ligase n=1 Tax=Candidatus Zambryskibacteria bacterium CG_4_9_14_3_um_filter_42_15 TaxID=1975112 RepID=A0A2M7WS40_9BACT|nr:MAG: UDP-N-acetylmuramoyl-L-alanyl-D-glutamate--2,6-diaminopimelate ligase [Candidatus Zambryskibacteria bacterium CG11_big_fil_rev_8_21_14_0_20_42_18]PJA32831.1 MAG: UDP-N-acetylmuramoyl-L-alanyl-D-glutamate--2,6-diaminopimelate ligase [Candidatus Zambryskibacteria bacterium CG_4_9_14_3_um_filter_42_15]